jgi:hypothetical protein
MKTALLLVASLLLCTAASAAVPSSINNDDSCDVKVGPAATLLLPYFEVNPNPTVPGQTTLFTVTNVTRYPQIAHVTLWTDWAFPVLSFNLFLTGYDVQAINLYDVIVRGTIAPPSGTTPATTPGVLSAAGGNLRPTLDCASNPSLLPASILNAARASLTTGIFSPGGGVIPCNTAGGVHANAIGYATIDVVANCTNLLPTDPAYYTTDLLFDNVLIGDYEQLGGSPAGAVAASFDAAGNPMVHIRAVPEGGGAGSIVATGLPYTFYDRYTPAANRTFDRRQPLPATFAARYIQGGVNSFATNMKIWREGYNGAGASCASHVNNASMDIGELVRFDEHENPSASVFSPICVPCGPSAPTLPAVSATNTANSSAFPSLSGTDVGGWLYLNLNNGGARAYSVTNHAGGTTTSAPTVFGTPRASQNWVTVTMFGNAGGNRMTAEFDAAPLGNGCSARANITTANGGPTPIGPTGGVFVCPPGTTLTNGTTALCTGTNVNPNP